ncbi:MAG: purine-cytosine permease family protein [Actinomycetota bacterium]
MDVLERIEATPDPGIEPVPPESRTLSALDVGVLWGDLGIGLLVIVTGALLAPALGFAAAATAIVLGSLIGVALLALTASAGAAHGVATMVLLRPVLGLRGSWLPSFLNFVQLIGWCAVEFWAMSYVADLVSDEVFGFSARPAWLAVVAIVCVGLALWGPVGVTRVWMERFGAWVVVSICLAITVLLIARGAIGDAIASSGVGGFPNFGQALDLVIAMPISWLPLVADYTRFARRPRGAFFGTFWGYLVANIWLYALGVLLISSAGSAPDPIGVAGGILAVAGGSFAGILFLAGLLAGETDEAFANIYSGAVSLQNIFPRVSQRALIVGIGLIAAGLAAVLTMTLYESFLFFLGSVFVPLFGILAADHFVNRRGRVVVDDLYKPGGRYWFSGGVRLRAFVPWIVGFMVFHWVNPSPLEPWVNLVTSVGGDPLSQRIPWLGGSIPAFAVAFLLTLVLPRLSSAPATTPKTGSAP